MELYDSLIDHDLNSLLDELNREHLSSALDFVKSKSEIEFTHHKDLETIVANWHDWYWFSDSERVELITRSLSAIKAKRLKQQQEQAEEHARLEKIRIEQEKQRQKKLNDIRSSVRSRIEKLKVSKEFRQVLIEGEINIQLHLFDLPEKMKETARENQYRDLAADLLNLLDDYRSCPDKHINAIINQWSEWIYLADKNRNSQLDLIIENSMREGWTILLESAGMKGSDLKKILSIELKVERKTLRLPLNEQAAELDRLHQLEARKLLSSMGILRNYDKSYSTQISKRWEVWFHLPKKDRKKRVTSIRDDFEQNEIDLRIKKSVGPDKLTLKKLEAYWKNKINSEHNKEYQRKLRDKASGFFQEAWNSLAKVPLRQYRTEKVRMTSKLKKKGFVPATIKIFFEGMDILFE